jgi:hypothetical protein
MCSYLGNRENGTFKVTLPNKLRIQRLTVQIKTFSDDAHRYFEHGRPDLVQTALDLVKSATKELENLLDSI